MTKSRPRNLVTIKSLPHLCRVSTVPVVALGKEFYEVTPAFVVCVNGVDRVIAADGDRG